MNAKVSYLPGYGPVTQRFQVLSLYSSKRGQAEQIASLSADLPFGTLPGSLRCALAETMKVQAETIAPETVVNVEFSYSPAAPLTTFAGLDLAKPWSCPEPSVIATAKVGAYSTKPVGLIYHYKHDHNPIPVRRVAAAFCEPGLPRWKVFSKPDTARDRETRLFMGGYAQRCRI